MKWTGLRKYRSLGTEITMLVCLILLFSYMVESGAPDSTSAQTASRPAEPPNKPSLIRPFGPANDGRLAVMTCGYGCNLHTDSFWNEYYAVDFALNGGGTFPIYAAAGGTIYRHDEGPAIVLFIRHNSNWQTKYSHLDPNGIYKNLANGQSTSVTVGEQIGQAGKTGASEIHLHFELRGGATAPTSFTGNNNWTYPLPAWSTNCLNQPLRLTTNLTISPATAAIGQPVTTSFTVKNTNPAGCPSFVAKLIGTGGRGPGGENDVRDFALKKDIRIEPKGTYPYSANRTFDTKGTYHFNAAVQDQSGAWHGIPHESSSQVERRSLSVTCSPWPVVTSFKISPTTPGAEQSVTATYTIRNDGCKEFTPKELLVGGRGPTNNVQDFPKVPNIKVAANGGTYTYSQSRSFSGIGAHSFVPGYTDKQGNWHELYNPSGKQILRTLSVMKCAGTPSGEFCAWYYNGISLAGSPVLSRVEQAPLNHSWGTGKPGSGVNSDNFSARWSGQFAFPAGNTTFSVRADDGVRLWVDGEMIIDQWKPAQSKTHRATKQLSQGTRKVVLEYYEGTGSASVQLSWQAAATPTPTATALPTHTPTPSATVELSPTPSPTVEPTATTLVEAPSETPEPTATEIEIPTDTPEPTATSEPIELMPVTETPESLASDEHTDSAPPADQPGLPAVDPPSYAPNDQVLLEGVLTLKALPEDSSAELAQVSAGSTIMVLHGPVTEMGAQWYIVLNDRSVGWARADHLAPAPSAQASSDESSGPENLDETASASMKDEQNSSDADLAEDGAVAPTEVALLENAQAPQTEGASTGDADAFVSPFVTGDQIMTSSELNLRAEPGTTSTIIAVMPAGASGSILSGPITIGPFSWYEVMMDGFGTGWAEAGSLVRGPSMAGQENESETRFAGETSISSEASGEEELPSQEDGPAMIVPSEGSTLQVSDTTSDQEHTTDDAAEPTSGDEYWVPEGDADPSSSGEGLVDEPSDSSDDELWAPDQHSPVIVSSGGATEDEFDDAFGESSIDSEFGEEITTETDLGAEPGTEVGLGAPQSGFASAEPYDLNDSGLAFGTPEERSLIDGDPNTAWMATLEEGATGAEFIVDLGALVPVSAIRWQEAPGGLSGNMTIHVTADGFTWSELPDDFARLDGNWQELPVDTEVAAVKFVFVDDQGIGWVGGLSEIEVWP
jgi:hypothetical protein